MTRSSLAAAVTGACATPLLGGVLRSRPPGGVSRWERTNFAGRTVSLTGGVAVAASLTAAAVAGAALAREAPERRAGTATALAVAAAGASGLYDDLGESAQRRAGEERPPKGLRGHLGALAQGRVTTGAAKIAGIGAGALAAGLILHAGAPSRATTRQPTGAGLAATGMAEVAVTTTLVAGTANLLNLLDLRPGRALKATALLTAPLAAGAGGAPAAVPATGAVATVVAAAPADLGERTMLGDTGANALGAAAGVALAAALPLPARTAAAAVAVALTFASERVSFSAIIAANPVLAALDGLGRRP